MTDPAPDQTAALNRRPGHLPLILAALALAAATGGGIYAVNSAASDRAAQLGREVTQLRNQLADDRIEINGLTSQVAGLNVPTDPLSAYNAVCRQYMTSDTTGITQPYWFPCTNSAQTIPRPGN